MPLKTDSSSPGDWLLLAGGDLDGVRHLTAHKLAYPMCLSKLAEVLEKVIKAELVRQGWFLVKTHDLVRLVDELRVRDPDLADCFQCACEELAERYFANRYPGFDLEDEDWPYLAHWVEEVGQLLQLVKERVEHSARED